EWLASWAAVVTKPSDLGYDDGDFVLPPLNIYEEMITVNRTEGGLFAVEARTLNEQRAAARYTLSDRVKRCAEIVNDTDKPFLVWCNLNAESEALKKAIPDAIEVKGSDSKEHKERAMLGFSDGTYKRLISKPSICGWGMNWQHCSNMAFVGLNNSFEQWYQAIRRCLRFGQKNPVNVYAITSNLEGAIRANLERKERDAERMIQEMVKYTRDITRRNVRQTVRETAEYNPRMKMVIPDWLRSEVV
ncbi:MAG TPA: helicase, partial [Pelotomaculum sp.]|nr:helicase [Pelotomaculum sp.]